MSIIIYMYMFEPSIILYMFADNPWAMVIENCVYKKEEGLNSRFT